MVGSALVEAMSGDLGGKVEILSEDFDPTAVVVEPVPPVVENGGEMGREEEEKRSKEIVLGRNVHTTCLAVTEPDANDEFTGDKEAYMASVLARYRKTLMERTKHHLGKACDYGCPPNNYFHLHAESLTLIFLKLLIILVVIYYRLSI